MKEYSNRLFKPISIYPLITFRILFGALMCVGAIRYIATGWIEKLYLEPTFFFKYYGFEWVQPLGEAGIFTLFVLMAVSAFCMMLGLFYRFAAVLFFLTFSYAQLIDATNYLNHYYLVCLLAFLLIFLPANRAFSLDVKANPQLRQWQVPAWTIGILIFQLTVVYTFAGVAKLHPDWLLRAMPLAIWLPERSHLPVLGYFFQWEWVAYAFSWVGAIYDLTIAYFLMYRPTRPFAYVAVVVFHLITQVLFNIGLFPMIMITSTLIFFSADFHKKLLRLMGYHEPITPAPLTSSRKKSLIRAFIVVYAIIQLALPLHHWWYDGKVLWTEEGYRLSWRVMVLEKSGHAVFTVKDGATDRQSEVINSDYLTTYQEKQMSIQPDFIVQFAHFLKKEYQEKYGFTNPIVTADVHVAVNGRMSKRLIDPDVNLSEQPFNLKPKSWVLKQRLE